MFTVKHVAPNGDEFAIEAESYEVQWDHQADIVRVMTYDQKHRDGNYTGLWVGVPARSGNRMVPDFATHTIYVMNRYGATVSTVLYADQQAACGIGEPAVDASYQADPSLLAA